MKRKIILSPLLIIILIILAGVGLAGAAIYVGGGSGGETNTQSINLQKGLVAWWKMDGNAKDSTPYRNHGTVTNANLTTDRKGQVNKAYDFNGSNARIDITHNSSLNAVSNSMSIAMWVKFDTVGVYQRLVAKAVGSPTFSGYAFEFHPTSTDIIRMRIGDGSATNAFDSLSTLVADTWYHLVGTYNGTSGIIYINGVADNQTDNAITVLNSSATFQLGLLSTVTNPFDGQMDDVRFYNRALSATEVTALYQTYDSGIQVATTQDDLIGHWTFDGDAKDRTPYRNHGTLSGDATVTANDRKGQTNKAATFDGTGDFVSVADNDNLSFGNGTTDTPFSISLWLKKDTSNELAVIAKGTSATAGEYHMITDLSDLLFFRVVDNSAGAYLGRVTQTALSNNTWYHVVGTYDGTAVTGGLKIYVNGTLQATNNSSSGTYVAMENLTDVLSIGSRGAGYFDGNIDDTRIYNRALSATEITALYESYNAVLQVSDLSKGLIGSWSFDGNAKDRTPYRNHGTITGASLITDRKSQVGRAYDFDGSTGFINVGNSTIFDTTSVTYAAWVKMDTAITVARIFEKGISSDFSFLMSPDSSEGDNMRCLITTSAAGYTATDPNTLSTGTWAHFACVYNATANTLSLYRNGTLVTAATSTTGTLITNTRQLNIGGKSSGAGGFFDGSIDDPRIWNRALSTTEVTALYESY